MKRNNLNASIYLMVLCAFISVLTACKKIDIQKNDFDVTAASATIKAGTPYVFNFTGDPDNITFFSGEPGKVYENKDRITSSGKPNLQFTSTHTAGTDQTSLSILVSNNFNGIYDSTDVKSATWTDITNRAILATNSTATPSGLIDLSDFVKSDGSPAYIAFKCASKTSNWTITNYNGSLINNVLTADNSLQIVADISSANWVNVNFYNPLVTWKPTTSSLAITTTASTIPSVNWAVSNAISLNRATADVGTPIKTIVQVTSPYTYTYLTPGTYTATFVANTYNTVGSNTILRKVVVTVTP